MLSLYHLSALMAKLFEIIVIFTEWKPVWDFQREFSILAC